jgi:hypothetical protein
MRFQFFDMWRHCPRLPRTVRFGAFLICIRRLNDGLLYYPRGPGFRISDFESNRIIAQLQVDGARSLMNGELALVTGAVRSVHTYLSMYVNYYRPPTGPTYRSSYISTSTASIGH